MDKKTTSKITAPIGKIQVKVQESLLRKPLVWVGILAVVPIVILFAFTFKSGFTPSDGNRKIEKIIVSKTPMEMAEEATQALQRNDVQTFFDIIDKAKDYNLVNSKGDSMLLVAVSLGNYDAVLRLLSLGADVNKQNSYTRDTPILRSLYTNHDDITRLLVASDANLNLENNYRHSPIFVAVERQKGEFVDLFITSGAQAGINSDNLFRWVTKRNLIGILAMLKGGVDPNVKNEQGNTPLIIAASLGDVESVRNLLAYRADPNAANKDGNTALIYAARYNHPQIIYELMRPYSLVAPVDVNIQNKQGETALYWAASRGYEEAVKRLLAANTNRDLKDKNGLTARDIAQKKGRRNIVALFDMDPTALKNMVVEMDNARIAARKRQEEAAKAKELAEKQKQEAAQAQAQEQAGYIGRRRRQAKKEMVQPTSALDQQAPTRNAFSRRKRQ
mgnify:CR=1 FL=1